MFKERLLYVFFYFMLDEKLSNFQFKSMKIQYICKLNIAMSRSFLIMFIDKLGLSYYATLT
jgi:hypothetical protein